MIWLQVRDVRAEHRRLAAAGGPRPARVGRRALGPNKMRTEDPDGVRTVLVEVPEGHPLRRDPR